MRARIIDRGRRNGRHYQFEVREIDIGDACIHCGGPRGKMREYQHPEDGAFYTVNQWRNPCGHVEHYDDLIERFGP